jgi:hypothetical protein
MAMTTDNAAAVDPEKDLLATLTRVVTILEEADVRFAVAGGCAVYARGGPPSDHDVDIFIMRKDAAKASDALVRGGMRAVDPPENWLTKVYDGDNLVDLIFSPTGHEVDEVLFERADYMRIGSAQALVVSGTDLMSDKLNVLEAHRCDFAPLLTIARALREQVDWGKVAENTAQSPYARAFLSLLADLGVTPHPGHRRLGHGKLEAQVIQSHAHRALAEDPRTAELSVQIDVGDEVHLRGEVLSEQRRAAVESVLREALPKDIEIRNDVTVSRTFGAEGVAHTLEERR